jgi:hypothetical protein
MKRPSSLTIGVPRHMPSNDDYCVLIDLLVILIFFYERFLLPLKNFLELPLIFEEFKKTEAADFFISLSF